MKLNSLQELYLEQLHDLYDAEQQIITALPKMIEEAKSSDLRNALTQHLEETKQQATRLETIVTNMGKKVKGEKCKGMEGVLKEASDLTKSAAEDEVRDAAIIAGAQRVEHYEMAGYGTARTYATLLGEQNAAGLLQQTLNEEKHADQKLTELSEAINVGAAETASGVQAKGQRVA